MADDNALFDAVYAIGIHYNERWQQNPYSSTEIAQSLKKSLRNSEGGPWKGDWDAFEYLVKLYNRNYITGKATNVITWSLVTSYFDNLSLPNSGLMIAKSPWSGYFEIQPALMGCSSYNSVCTARLAIRRRCMWFPVQRQLRHIEVT